VAEGGARELLVFQMKSDSIHHRAVDVWTHAQRACILALHGTPILVMAQPSVLVLLVACRRLRTCIAAAFIKSSGGGHMITSQSDSCTVITAHTAAE
jgi:hypothetical protein